MNQFTPEDKILCGIGLISQKWVLSIIYYLISTPAARFSDMQAKLGVNASTLSARLQLLEANGLVRREVIDAMPPHAVYTLTEAGNGLKPVIAEIDAWFEKYFPGMNGTGQC